MADDDQGAPQGGDGGQNTGDEQGTEQQAQQPPWGSDEEFNPEKAWRLLQNVRGDLEKVKADRDAHKAKVDEFDRGKLSDQEKLAADLDGYKSRAEKAEGALLRMEVAAEKGLTPAQAKRLQGTTKEELTEDADDLLSTFTPAAQGAPPSNRPREQYRGGASDPGEPPEEHNPAKLAELIRNSSRFGSR